MRTGDQVFAETGAGWDELLRGSAQRGYFLRPEWNQLWWEHCAPRNSRLYIIECRDGVDGSLVGLAPLYLRRRRLLGCTHVSELLFIGTGIDLRTSEGLDIIARRGCERAVGLAVAGFLRERNDWDRIWLWHVPRDSQVFPFFLQAIGGRTRVAVCDRVPYADTSGDWNSFKRGLGRNMRNKVEYYPRRLFRRHDCEFRRVQTIPELELAINALIEVHQARWQSKGEAGSFAQPGFESLLREATRLSLPDGRLRLWTLRVDGVIQAALLGFLDDGVVHYLQQGYNPAFSRENLGVTLLALCLCDCVNDPEIRAFDFMGGRNQYKDLWANHAAWNVECEVIRPNVKAVSFLASRIVAKAFRACVRGVTPEQLRAFIRTRLRPRPASARPRADASCRPRVGSRALSVTLAAVTGQRS